MVLAAPRTVPPGCWGLLPRWPRCTRNGRASSVASSRACHRRHEGTETALGIDAAAPVQHASFIDTRTGISPGTVSMWPSSTTVCGPLPRIAHRVSGGVDVRREAVIGHPAAQILSPPRLPGPDSEGIAVARTISSRACVFQASLSVTPTAACTHALPSSAPSSAPEGGQQAQRLGEGQQRHHADAAGQQRPHRADRLVVAGTARRRGPAQPAPSTTASSRTLPAKPCTLSARVLSTIAPAQAEGGDHVRRRGHHRLTGAAPSSNGFGGQAPVRPACPRSESSRRWAWSCAAGPRPAPLACWTAGMTGNDQRFGSCQAARPCSDRVCSVQVMDISGLGIAAPMEVEPTSGDTVL